MPSSIRLISRSVFLLFLLSIGFVLPQAEARRSARGVQTASVKQVTKKARSNKRALPKTKPGFRNKGSKSSASSFLGRKRGDWQGARQRSNAASSKHRPSKHRSPKKARAERTKAKKSKAKGTRAKSAKRTAKAKAKANSKFEQAKVFASALVKSLQVKWRAFTQRPAVQRMAKRYERASAALTRTLDSWQSRAPPWLATSIDTLRTYSLPNIARFAYHRVAADAEFLGKYMTGNAVTSYFILPGAISFGMSPATSITLNLLTTPITLAVIIAREQYLRHQAGEKISFVQTARSVLSDYKTFAQGVRSEASRKAAEAIKPWPSTRPIPEAYPVVKAAPRALRAQLGGPQVTKLLAPQVTKLLTLPAPQGI